MNLPDSRIRLTRVLRDAGDVVQTDRAAEVLTLGRTETSKVLARWSKQGWLKRIGPGKYLPVPIEALESDRVLADPWILVPALFDPGFVTGWSAAEHWDLTEQIFRDVVVKTCRLIRPRRMQVHGISFVLRQINAGNFFGTKLVWRGQTRVSVADRHRCLLDMLNEPLLGGGIQHVADCFGQYLRQEADTCERLIDYGDILANGAVFKRLGFLAEREGMGTLVHACKDRLTSGHAKLDPKLDCPRLVTRWGLRVPDSWTSR